MDDNLLTFIDDTEPLVEKSPQRFWKVMVIDDEKSVHDITCIALKDFIFEDRGLVFTGSGSAVSKTAFDKHKTQQIFQNAGVTVPWHVCITFA